MRIRNFCVIPKVINTLKSIGKYSDYYRIMVIFAPKYALLIKYQNLNRDKNEKDVMGSRDADGTDGM